MTDERLRSDPLKGRYFRLMDTKDWTGFRELFCDDVVIDVTGSGGVAAGQWRLVSWAE
ncbi:nuclear transport factor 2 family protein [Nocardia carnea]|uniref:nuclear transport factor 2 family protein n=1 Tax=Nocardia carnea TaxID=37328 RepID=UPI0024571383|nr:nuclear transport factor 2 family protein [Nocardia carnea]